MRRLPLVLVLGLFLSLPSCAAAARGTAVIAATQADSPVSGQATLVEEADGLHVSIRVENVSPGKHGLHFHEFAECGDAGKAAGSHYNPEGAPHGLVSKDGLQHAHAGDLGNIEVGADGTGVLEVVIPGLCLKDCKYSLEGRSVILHEKEDDFGQPLGNAGGRIGCGPILLAAE